MNSRETSMALLRGILARASEDMLKVMLADVQKHLALPLPTGQRDFFHDAQTEIMAEIKGRDVVPDVVVELLKSLPTDMLVQTRVNVTTMPPTKRVVSFVRAINKELNARGDREADRSDKECLDEVLKNVPTDLREMFTQPAPEQAPRVIAKPRVGIGFTLEQLDYLDRAVSNYHDPEKGDEDIAEEILDTVEMARSAMKGGLT